MATKICHKCRIEKPLSEFAPEKRSKDGHRYSCRECDRKRYRDYASRKQEERISKRREWRKAHPGVEAQYQSKYRRVHRAKNLIRHAKRRSEIAGLPFDLDLHTEEIQARIDAGRCEITGLPLRIENGRAWDSPSIDRIDPKKGYVYSNIRIVCHAMNCALGDWGEDILRMVVLKWMNKE